MWQRQFKKWFLAYQQAALAQQERRLILLSGELTWSIALVNSVIAQENSLCHIYSDHSLLANSMGLQSYRHQLGTESQYVIFADSQFNIDALAALSGTLVAGGVLFVLLPATTIADDNAFMQRFFQQLERMPSHVVIEQAQQLEQIELLLAQQCDVESNPVLSDASLSSPIAQLAYGCLTQEQVQAVEAICKVMQGHRNRPLVLTADRGRGKSSALAIACSQLVLAQQVSANSHKLHIVISAAHVKALTVFFKQLALSLPQAVKLANKVTYDGHLIEFLPIDQLIAEKVSASLVLVDEAAALPVYLLAQLLNQYHRLVFASTVHGYEGAGRGFSIKFQKIIAQRYPQWQKLHVNQPMRWREQDPLEKFIFELCLLNADLLSLPTVIEQEQTLLSSSALDWQLITTTELLANEALLQQVFSVLVTAHYQTKPSDLKLLLDNPNVYLHCVTRQQQIVAVALLIKEGQVSSDELLAVQQGRRRLPNQFIPQSLLVHCGQSQAFDFSYLRISRIAVHPECQQQGIGTFLLNKIASYALAQGVDFIGTSFGINEELAQFWCKADYKLVRLGFNQDAASGEHSALMLTVITAKSQLLLTTLQQQFYRSFDYLLTDEYKSITDKLVWLILHYCPENLLPELTDDDLMAVTAFAKQERLYSSCVYSLHLWFLHQFRGDYQAQTGPIISRLLKKYSIEQVCVQYHLTGKKALTRLMLNYVNKQLC